MKEHYKKASGSFKDLLGQHFHVDFAPASNAIQRGQDSENVLCHIVVPVAWVGNILSTRPEIDHVLEVAVDPRQGELPDFERLMRHGAMTSRVSRHQQRQQCRRHLGCFMQSCGASW